MSSVNASEGDDPRAALGESRDDGVERVREEVREWRQGSGGRPAPRDGGIRLKGQK